MVVSILSFHGTWHTIVLKSKKGSWFEARHLKVFLSSIVSQKISNKNWGQNLRIFASYYLYELPRKVAHFGAQSGTIIQKYYQKIAYAGT